MSLIRRYERFPRFSVRRTASTTFFPGQISEEYRNGGTSNRSEQDLSEYFAENRESVLRNLRELIDQEKYADAVAGGKSLLSVSNGDELRELVLEAEEKLRYQLEAKAKAEKETKTRELVTQLRNVPESQYETNKQLYGQLVRLNPRNTQYRNKLDFYSQKISEQEEKAKRERESRIAAFGSPPIQSAWDGSYLPVERYLEATANDPDSIEIDGCTDLYHIKDGWLVRRHDSSIQLVHYRPWQSNSNARILCVFTVGHAVCSASSPGHQS